MNDKIIKTAKLDDLLNLFSNVVNPEDVMYAKVMSQISSSIVKERLSKGMNQKEFADYTRVSEKMISQLESGISDISLKELSKIAVSLNMELQLDLIQITKQQTA